MRGVSIHRIFVAMMMIIVVSVATYMAYFGYDYYSLSVEDRFFNPNDPLLKSGGILGHGFGIIGSLLIIIGVATYMLRKRVRKFSRLGILKYWLEFHIFLCVLGPILVLYHTSFKFGGLVSISFWSMVAVVISGVIGRYIYLQIPHTIEGREMNLQEIEQIKDSMNKQLSLIYKLDEKVLEIIMQTVKKQPDRLEGNLLTRRIKKFSFERKTMRGIKLLLKQQNISKKRIREVLKLIRTEMNLNRKIERLMFMQNLFKYWHVAHLPFAVLMLIIMVVHVIVTITFGARWIF